MNETKNPLVPLAGYAIDAYRKVTHDLEWVPHSLTKIANIRAVQKRTGAETAIEIGTFKGVTTRRLAKTFSRVLSVELDDRLYRRAVKKISLPNVHLFHGDGKQLLPDLIANNSGCLVFLDGHFSGGETALGDEPEPVLAELDVLANHSNNLAAVVIDDFRLFGVEADWPTKGELLTRIDERFTRDTWRCNVIFDQVIVYRT